MDDRFRVAPPAARPTGGAQPTADRGRRLLVAVCLAVVAAQAACTSSAPSTSPARLLDCGAAGTFMYASPPDADPNQTSLDVYTPASSDGEGDDGCAGRPLVVWVHGGGWTSGDKSEFMTHKVPLFNGAGYVFASINYRLTDPALSPPSPQYPVHDADSAAAVAWLVDHADQLGVDPARVAVLGHSAGGGITAAIATDERFLAAHDLPLTTISCAGSMDGEGYDVTAGATTAPEDWRSIYTNAFGTDPEVWAEASPINHVAPDKGIARFFIAARGVDWRVDQHLAFIGALREADVPVTALDSRALEHADLTTVIGSPDDHLVTPALMDFLGGCFSG